MLKISNLTKNYGKIEVLKNVNLELENGEIISILGHSGCGKSTLLRLIAELETPCCGEIEKKSDVAFMFQQYALFPNLSVFDNVAFALHKLDEKSRKTRVLQLLEKFEITQIANKKPDEISGGQAQRVAFARAVANGEKLLLLDEPFSNLDENLKDRLRRELKDLIVENNLSAIMVTHDKFDAFLLSDKIAIMDKGEILDFGTPQQLYLRPKNAKTARFLGDINVFTQEDLKKLPQDLASKISEYKNLIRPQNFYLDLENGYEAKVVDSIFFGQFYKIEIEMNGVRFFMFSQDELKDKIKISLKMSEISGLLTQKSVIRLLAR